MSYQRPEKGMRLTKKEKQVMSLVIKGLDNGTIADEMGVGVQTIRNHLYKTYQKMGVNNRVEAVVWGLRTGLLELYDADELLEEEEKEQEKKEEEAGLEQYDPQLVAELAAEIEKLLGG